MSKHTELKKRAEAATPGPWIEVDDEDSAAGAVFIVPTADVWMPPICRITAEHNAAFITSANPAAVLELIDDHESMLKALEGMMQVYGGVKWDTCAVEIELQNLSRAAIARAKGESQ